MDEAKEAIKELGKKIKRHYKRVIQAIIVLIFLLILLGGAVYYTTVDDGTYKEDDWSSTPYGAGQYKNGVTVDADGNLKNGMTAQELWDKMIENKSRVDEYLDGPEELARLMRAEIVTKYPDTRPKPDEEIKWEELIKNPDIMQGIIKFKRAGNDGNKTTMRYVSPSTFQGYIDTYNQTGSEEAKQNALHSFTLKKASSKTGPKQTGPELYWPAEGTQISSPFGPRSSPTAGASSNHGGIDIPVSQGSNVYVCEKGTVTSAEFTSWGGNMVVVDHGNGYVTKYEHNSQLLVSAGDTVEKAQVIALAGSTGISTGPHVHFQVEYNGEKIDPLGFKYHNGMGNGTGGFGVSEDSTDKDKKDKDKKEDKDKKDKDKKQDNAQKATATSVDGDGYVETYTSSAGITYKHFKQIYGSYRYNPYWDGTINSSGCGPTSVSILASGILNSDKTPADIASEMNNVYGYTSYVTLSQEMESLGMPCEVIHSPSAQTIQDNLKNGKVMLVSVNSGTIFTGGSHIMAIVDINEQGQVYIGNPSSFTKQGWYDVSELMKGCDYIITTEAGASGIASTSNSSGYTAVVATWTQVDTTVTSNDPAVGNPEIPSIYTMTTTNVNYEEMVDAYTMPFDLLWALLVVGEDKNFIFELIDLIYNSDIQITIHDNLTTNTDIDEWHYTMRQKAEVDATIYSSSAGKSATSRDHCTHDPHAEKDYITTKTVITQTNTLSIALTKADVWIVDYENEYTYLGAVAGEPVTHTVTKRNEVYPDSPTSTGDSYSCEHINALKEKTEGRVKTTTTHATSSVTTETKTEPITSQERIKVEYYTKYINISDNISNQTTTQRYIPGLPRIVEEKTDKKSKRPNFVTIFRKGKYKNNKRKIKDAAKWLFEIIETNENIADYWPDLMRYLLYKATGRKYNGVDEFDFNIFKPGSFKKIGGGGNLGIDALTKTDLSKEEFVALVQGYSAAISKGARTQEFRDNASVVYEVCVANNINPVFCAAQAWREQNWDDPNTSPHNYWGIAVYNGQNYGSSWGTMEEAVQAYCDQINSQATMSIYIEKAQRYATVDSRFKGDMSTIYDVFSAYAYIGDGHTLVEEANYVGDYIDSLSGIAAQIFGQGIM